MANVSNKKLILAFDAKRLFNNFTGLGNYSRTLIKNLQIYYPQHEYHLFTPKIRENEETDYFINSGKFIIHSSSRPLWRTFGISKEVKKINADIYHGLSHEIPFQLPENTRSVVTFHDLIYEIHPHQFGLWDRMMYKLKYKSSAQKADFIVSISQSTKNDLQRIYKLPDHKIVVIPQSCQDVFQTEPHVHINPQIQLKDYYLYVGSIIPRKNLLLLVKAFARLENSLRKPFVIVGRGPDDYVNQVHHEIEKNNLKPWFTFLSQVNNNHLVSLYDQSYALCYPSVYEGFGIPVIESLFRKKPVITSSTSSLPEAVGPGGICVDPSSIDELMKAFKIISIPETYNELAAKGCQYVTERFSARATARNLMEFYQSIL